MKKIRHHYLESAAMTLLLVMFATIGARADEGTLSGSGTAADPYLIGCRGKVHRASHIHG